MATLQERPSRGVVEVLTDTQGVDFGPYVKRLSAGVRAQWYERIPEEAVNRKGHLAIEVAILPDGKIKDMRLVATAGDVVLDRPAWDAIRSLAPFPKLPKTYTGPELVMRLRFYYNPDKGELDGSSQADRVVHAVLAKPIQDSGLPQYPRKALEDNVEGMVRLEAQIDPAGAVKNVVTVEGSPLLGEAACTAIQKWTFRPARSGRKAVDDNIRINVEFHLDGERIKAQIVSPEPSANSHR